MPGERTLLGALGLAGLLLQAPYARAEPPPRAGADAAPAAPTLAPKLELEGPEMEAKDRARELFQRGVAAYREGKYYEAVEIFLETQRIYPDTQLCFNVARAYENLGNVGGALRYYREYLRRADRPSDGAEVTERVRKLEHALAQRGVQQLTVLSSPEGATVLLDSRPVGITPWTGEIYPGQHRLKLELDGRRRDTRVISVDPHAAKDVMVTLEAEPLPKPPTLAPTTAKDVGARPAVTVPTLVALSSGLALLGGALIAQAASDAPGMSDTTAFLAGGGVGACAVGGVMLYFDWGPRAPSLRLER